MRANRVLAVMCLIGVFAIGIVGCDGGASSKADANASAEKSTDKSKQSVGKDDPEAIAMLEKEGATIQRGSKGEIIAVDLRDAGGGKPEHFAAIAKLPSVKTITCTGAEVNNDAIKALAGHPSLEKLNATLRSGIGDSGAEVLGTIGTLVDLNLEKSEISDAAYEHFAKLKKLRYFRAPFTKTTDAGLTKFANSPQLELLDFRDCTGVTDDGILAIAALKKLRSFKVWGSQITDKCLPALSGMVNLSTLGLQDTHVEGQGDALASLSKLQELDAFRSHFSDAGLKAVSSAVGMKVLKLRDCRVTPEGLKLLSKFKDLERLDLSESQADDSTLEAISGLNKLFELELWTSRITDDGLAKIVNLPLKNLVLEDIYDISDAGLVHVGKIKTLESLTLSKTGVTDDGLKELAGLENLKVLMLDNTVVSKKGVAALRAKLPKLETVRF